MKTMRARRPTERKGEVFRSMAEFRQRFFPKAHAAAEEKLDPAQFGPRLAERAMEGFRKRLASSKAKCGSE